MPNGSLSQVKVPFQQQMKNLVGAPEKKIEEKLVDYQGKYQVILVPNITNIVYGRDVGYKIEKVELGTEIESISATEVRNRMRSEGKL